MAARGFDPKETVIEAFYAAKELVGGFFNDFKSSDKFFKYKVGIVALWAFLSLSTAVVACPGSEGPNNSLSAQVKVVQVLDETSVTVLNQSSSEWRDVRLLLNGAYTAYQPTIEAGRMAVLTLRQFAGPGGVAVPAGTHPSSMKITCSEGSTVVTMGLPVGSSRTRTSPQASPGPPGGRRRRYPPGPAAG